MGENTAVTIIMTMATTTTMMSTVMVRVCECNVGLLYHFVGPSSGNTSVLH